MTEVSAQDVEALVRTFDASTWDELRVVVEGVEIYLSKNPSDRGRSQLSVTRAGGDTAAQAAAGSAVATGAGSPTRAGRPAAADAVTIPAGQIAVRAPNLGTFYRAPKPGAPPYVTVGQMVEADTEICLIEVMKLFTPVRAGIAGTVRSICVEDAQLVEYDQPLFLIEPSA